ncbi:MAG: hypothetical protein ACAI44_11525 [Candidatus Sericytochromatia bacterium]
MLKATMSFVLLGFNLLLLLCLGLTMAISAPLLAHGAQADQLPAVTRLLHTLPGWLYLAGAAAIGLLLLFKETRIQDRGQTLLINAGAGLMILLLGVVVLFLGQPSMFDVLMSV